MGKVEELLVKDIEVLKEENNQLLNEKLGLVSKKGVKKEETPSIEELMKKSIEELKEENEQILNKKLGVTRSIRVSSQ